MLRPAVDLQQNESYVFEMFSIYRNLRYQFAHWLHQLHDSLDLSILSHGQLFGISEAWPTRPSNLVATLPFKHLASCVGLAGIYVLFNVIHLNITLLMPI